MTATPVSGLAGRLQRELERERKRRFSELGDDPLAWLAFVPLWTDRVAHASRFPDRPLPLPELLTRAEAAGWCVRKVESGPRTPYLRLEVAVDLLPHAYPLEIRSGPHWKAIEEEAAAIPDEAIRASLIARLVGSSPERARSSVEEAGSLDDVDPVRAARALREAAGELPEREVSIRADHLLLKLASTAAAPRAVALGDVAAALARKKLTDQTLRVAERIEDTRVRAAALGELVAALGLPAGRSRPMLDTVVEQCWRTATGADGSLDPTVAAGFAGQLAASRRDGDIRRLATDALAVAEHALPTPALVGAMQRIGDALDAVNRQRRPFDPRFLKMVLRLASGIGDPVARAAALASTAAWMRRYDPPPEVYGPISGSGLLDAARAIEHGEDRVRALARVVPLLPQDLRREVAEEALALAGQVEEGAGAVSFWMPDTARAAVIEELRRRRDFRWLQQTAGRIGASVREAARSVAVPAPLARWAELAVAALPVTRERPAQRPIAPPTLSSKSAAAHLDRRIAELLAAGDTGQALTWLDTARSLSPLLLGEFEVGVLANTRRVELVYRRWLDQRRLERFLPRAEPLRAFEDLLDQPEGPAGAWALHYLGVGGVGKTMLIRHLTTELAPARDALTSRIDFDHLNPDFPRRRPAQLVVELAAELETQAQDTRLIGLYRQAYEALQEVNARARPVSLEDEDFAKALRTFAGFLQALRRRVVLILDTCEELEKFRPAGGRLEQLEATFEVLEALHRQVPSLRVVLAGRRPLARSGRGWRLTDLADRRHALLPESKPYLLLHEVRGFDRSEAEEFLTRHAGLRPDVPELIAAILGRCPDPGNAADVEWEDGHRPPEAPRYNPFDLDLIAGWVRTEPHMTVAELRASRSDLYVETRIVGRLKNPGLERLLPAVVALGRFEHEMLLPAFDLGEQAIADAERELASAEWIDVQRDEALDTTFLEVDRSLRPRLEGYFRREHPGLLREAARRLAPGLSSLAGDPGRPLSRLGFDHVDAALRLLPPAEAARLVDRLAMRVVEEAAAQEGAWGWAATVAERLLAEGSPLAEPDHPAGPGLRAMLASALRHLDPQRDLSELWAAVEQSVGNHPDPETAEWLAQRAYLQLLVAASGADTLERLLASLRVRPSSAPSRAPPQAEVRRQVLIGGMLSALQDLLDLAEADSRPARLPGTGVAYHAVYLAVADPAAETGNPAADAFRRMLLGRAALLQGQLDEARAAFDAVVSRLGDDEFSLTPWLCADWEPPQDLLARIRLESIRARLLAGAADTALTAGEPFVESPRSGKQVAETAVSLGAIDAERFASAALAARLAHEVVPAEVLELYERAADLYDQRWPLCEAHRAVPPFFITLARGLIALGRVRRALEVLQRGHVAAVERRDAATVTAAASAQMEAVRRFRLVDEYRSRRQQLLYSADPADRQRVWPVLALIDPVEPSQPPWQGDQHAPPSPSASPADWHAWWRVQSAAAGLDRAIELMTQRHRGPKSEPRSFTGLSLALDMAEVHRIRLLPSPPVTVRTIPWAAEHPLEAEHAVRLELRQFALFDDAAPDLDRWVALLGARRVAELALDEGELLGLRLPDRAQKLFSRAARLFSQAEDPVGGFIARVLAALTFEEGEQGAAIAVSGLKTAHEQLPRGPEGEPLLPWPDLLALGRTRRRFDHPDWAGWAPRLLVAFARLNGASQAEALSLADDLGLHSAELPGLLGVRSDLPPSHTGEFEAVPPRTPPTKAVRAPPPSASSVQSSPRPAASPEAVPPQAVARPGREWGSYPSPRVRAPRRWLRLLTVMLVVSTALVAAAFFVMDLEGWTSQVTPAEGAGLPWGLISGLVTGVAVVATILVALLNLRQRRTHASERRVETPQPPRRARAPGTVARLRPLLPTRANLGTLAIRPAVPDDSPRFELLGVRAWSGGRPGFGPYSRQLGLVPESLPTRVALRVAPELAELPWEAFVLPATRPSLWARRACWRELRLLPATRRTPTRPSWWRRRHGLVGVLASASWLPLLEGSFSNIEVLGQGERRSERPHTLVTVGTPVQTSSGIRFQLEVEETERQIFVERSIDPDAPALYDHQLVVVVGHPGDAYARVDAERETTADLRQCAADVAAAGAGSVLCLPSMPADLAARVLAELDRRLWQVERRGWSALVAATESIRKLIETSLPDSDERREVARELALEVTMFVRTDRAT